MQLLRSFLLSGLVFFVFVVWGGGRGLVLRNVWVLGIRTLLRQFATSWLLFLFLLLLCLLGFFEAWLSFVRLRLWFKGALLDLLLFLLIIFLLFLSYWRGLLSWLIHRLFSLLFCRCLFFFSILLFSGCRLLLLMVIISLWSNILFHHFNLRILLLVIGNLFVLISWLLFLFHFLLLWD